MPSTAAEAAITGAGTSGQAWLKLIGPPCGAQGHVDEHQLGVVDVQVTSLGRLAEGVEGSKVFAPGQTVPRALGRITKVAVPPMVGEGALLSLNLIRTAERWYVQRDGEAFPIDAQLPSTAVLLTKGLESVRVAASDAAGGVPADGLSLLSPVTTPCRVVAQAVNYRSHAEDAGAGEDPPPVFFRKSSASISAPTGDVIRPAHVRLLDYELEVGLVMGHQLPIGAAVTDADLPSYVAGLVMCNDLSARDVQLEKGQFYESKSYPTFTPTGPRLVLLDADDFGRLAGLRLRLWVNGELRQDATAADMITRPAAALSVLARFQPLDPGDLVLTGTPGGTALQAPPAVIEKLGDLLPTPLKWRVFFSRQERNPAYLKAGDVVTASIANEDGTLDLGAQRLVVRDGDGPGGI